MKYNFDTIINRHNTNSIKYDFAHEKGKPEGLIPMWVADMDFPLPPEVLADIQKVAEHGIFGYTEPKDDYYNAISEWFSSHFNFHITKHEIVKTPGVVFAIAAAIRAFSQPNESILIQTPVYYPFYDVIRDNGRNIVTNSLVYTRADECPPVNHSSRARPEGAYKNGSYSINFEDFEQKIKENKVKLFILCSPHNPVGRVWTREELEHMNSICKNHGVIIFSDEIHCDFVWSGYSHTSFSLINEDAIIGTAPSKTFNLAGLQVSNIIIKNATLREKLIEKIRRTGYSQLNTLGLTACQSAYVKGWLWLEELKLYLEDNIQLVRDFLKDKLPKIKLIEPQATYLLWLDFSEFGFTQEELNRRITEDATLWLSDGAIFGEEGKGFQRINIACPRATLLEALNRLEKAFKTF